MEASCGVAAGKRGGHLFIAVKVCRECVREGKVFCQLILRHDSRAGFLAHDLIAVDGGGEIVNVNKHVFSHARRRADDSVIRFTFSVSKTYPF